MIAWVVLQPTYTILKKNHHLISSNLKKMATISNEPEDQKISIGLTADAATIEKSLLMIFSL